MKISQLRKFGAKYSNFGTILLPIIYIFDTIATLSGYVQFQKGFVSWTAKVTQFSSLSFPTRNVIRDSSKTSCNKFLFFNDYHKLFPLSFFTTSKKNRGNTWIQKEILRETFYCFLTFEPQKRRTFLKGNFSQGLIEKVKKSLRNWKEMQLSIFYKSKLIKKKF